MWRSRAGANQQGAGSDGQKEQRSLQRRLKEGRRGGEGEIGNKRKGEGGCSWEKKAAEGNTEKLEKKVQDLQGKVKAKKAFIEEQNNIQKTAHAKGEKMKSAEALRQNLRAAKLARMTVERESKDLYDLQEHLSTCQAQGQEAKKLLSGQIS